MPKFPLELLQTIANTKPNQTTERRLTMSAERSFALANSIMQLCHDHISNADKSVTNSEIMTDILMAVSFVLVKACKIGEANPVDIVQRAEGGLERMESAISKMQN